MEFQINNESDVVDFIDDTTLMEKLADIEHQRWSDWQSYVHSKCKRDAEGNLIIPAELVKHWEYQISTSYANLSEEDKQKDRDQVMRYWDLIKP